jgi:hypothetical protein
VTPRQGHDSLRDCRRGSGATPVTEEYRERGNEFTGKIEKVTVELK